MVRTYKKKKTKSYSQEDIEDAKKLVFEERKSITEASKLKGIPRQTLSDKVKGVHGQHVGGQTVLRKKEESLIAHALKYASKYGWPQERSDLVEMINQYCILANVETPWRKGGTGRPGIEFIRNFEKRWAKILTVRRTQNLTTARMKSLANGVIDEFFTMLERVYDKYELKTKRKLFLINYLHIIKLLFRIFC